MFINKPEPFSLLPTMNVRAGFKVDFKPKTCNRRESSLLSALPWSYECVKFSW